MNRLDTVLLMSADKEKRQIIRMILMEKYNILEAESLRQTRLLAKQNESSVTAVILDLPNLPESEKALLQDQNFEEMFPDIPVIGMCEKDDSSILDDVFRLGAADVIPMSYNSYAMLHRINTIIDLNAHRKYFERKVAEQANELHRTYEKLLETLTSIIEFREMETGEHILRIRFITNILIRNVAKACPEYGLTEEDIESISSASALHDIGKIGIPDAILTKPGKLTQEEWLEIKKHPEIGCEILSKIVDADATMYMRYAYNICRYHHERWDGGGYPEGLAGEAIPICAQVVGLADCFDALLSKRHYKEAFSFQRTMNMILNGECGVFSPKLLECFKASAEELLELAKSQENGILDAFHAADPGAFSLAPRHTTGRETGQLVDTLAHAQGKYLALMHYIEACVLEIAYDDQHFHLRYNPYPELLELGNIHSMDQIRRYMVDNLVVPEEQAQMRSLMEYGIEHFLDSGMRHKSYKFHLHDNNGHTAEYDVTLMRVDIHQKEHRTFAILFKKRQASHDHRVGYNADMMDQSTYCCYNDRYYTLVDMGGGVDTLMGYTKDEIMQYFSGQLVELVHPEDRGLLEKIVDQQLCRYRVAQMEYRMIHKDGSIHWVVDRSILRIGSDGMEYIYAYLTDITESKESVRETQDKIKRYDMILSRTDNILFSWEYETGKLTYSDISDTTFGEIGITDNISRLFTGETSIHPDDLPLIIDKIVKLEHISSFEVVDVRIASGRGEYIWYRIRGSTLRNEAGNLMKIVGIIININEEKKKTLSLIHEASKDPLTGLLNKQAVKQQAEDYFTHYRSAQVSCAMLMVDLDNFKMINDRYGHLYGDAILTRVAGELRRLFRSQDLVARIGGDEFLILMRGIPDRTLVDSRCQRIMSNLKTAFSNNGDLPLSCSIGVSISPEDGTTYSELLRKADMALYAAKAQGKNKHIFYDAQNSAYFQDTIGRRTQNTVIDSDVQKNLSNTYLVQHLFRMLYTAPDLHAAINNVLSIVGEASKVSRVYIFENSDDGVYCSNTYEWCKAGVEPQIQLLQNVHYELDIPGYREAYDENGILYCTDIMELSEPVYNIVAPQGIRSMLHCAMSPGGVFRGYIGFDDCDNFRLWTKEEIDLLQYFSEMLSMFLDQEREKKRMNRKIGELTRQLEELQ